MCRAVPACANEIKNKQKNLMRFITYWEFPLDFLCVRETDQRANCPEGIDSDTEIGQSESYISKL